MLWNSYDDREDWVGQLAELTGNAMRSSRRDLQIPELPELFEPAQVREVAHEQSLTPAGLRDLVQTHSGFLLLDSAGQTALLGRVDRLLAEHPDVAGRDRIDLPYSTLCWRAGRR